MDTTITTIDGQLAESALREAGELPTTIGGFEVPLEEVSELELFETWNEFEGRCYVAF